MDACRVFLWYALFSVSLLSIGFTLNPCNLCVANKIIDGKQCTIVWHVGDSKILYKSKSVVQSITCELEKKIW